MYTVTLQNNTNYIVTNSLGEKVDIIGPSDTVSINVTNAIPTLSLIISSLGKAQGNRWKGVVPANTTQPISITITPDNNIEVSLDETAFPNQYVTSSTMVLDTLLLAALAIGILLLLVGMSKNR